MRQRSAEAELLQEPRQEQEQLVLRQLLAQAVALPHQEGDAALVLAKTPGPVQKPLRHEGLRLHPVGRVVHDPPDVGVDGGAGGQGVAGAGQGHLLSGGMRRGVHDARVAQHLVDDRVGVGHRRPVLEQRCA